MKIAIIGAGAAGLASLRHGLKQGHDCTAFEQTGNIGGTWNYTDLVNVDENGLPVHSSMYQGLKTNLPKELMEYDDFPYEERGKSFIAQPEVLDYMKKFANHFNLYSHIKFLTQVTEVDPLPDNKWKIKEKNLKTKVVTEHIFDAVMVCVGNYSVPKIPKIEGSEKFIGKIIHSHHYRKPDGYKGKKVLVIGAGPSGIDISRIVGKVAEKVYISYGSTFFFKTEDYVIHKPLVKSLTAHSAIFENGTEEAIDSIIYCTGYVYSYPFLTDRCGIKIENNWVQYVYKHIVNVEHPSMGFIGVTFKVCPFPTFDIQVRFFLEFIKNIRRLTKEQMMADIMNDVAKRKAQAMPAHHVHKIGHSLHRIYFDDLADTVKIPRARPVIHNLYEHLANNRTVDKRYKIINDEEFQEVV
ncbi:hypothetical protein GWI33_022771 [Rhynchophorus ferrugineus]|uniref:Flavin-containing monooxygenase n=1 Tax=Rhynchophorus ferrugineus TaxID=354439 RepID=A0A834IU24_RHYFE|nr:hypothetical protein GWI33_022771 [Rhynchophorus ferrugineus]